MARIPALLCAAAVGAAVAAALAPPPLDALASIWQPVDAPTYGAPSVTNAFGSVLASVDNVLGFNALEMAPFSSGWDAALLCVAAAARGFVCVRESARAPLHLTRLK